MKTQTLNISDSAMRVDESVGERLVLNMGPSHPSTHGVLRLILELDGEVITKATPDIGYLHRAAEKIAENMTWTQFIPYTDRLDYLAPLANNVAYACAVEKLMGYELPLRAKVIRVICCELARISAHLLGIGAYAMDAGAFSIFLYAFTEREKIYNLIEMLTGARLTTSYTRIGGIARDASPAFLEEVKHFIDQLLPKIDDIERLLNRNPIFLDRTRNVGIISKEDALDYGVTGPNLRAAGVNYDVRKKFPYLDYDQYDFAVPLGSTGDCYDRYLVRMQEIRESTRILEQAVVSLPSGPIFVEDAKNILPRKEKTLSRMEELIHHFMVSTQGIDAPAGEIYFAAENPKGELGFYINSRGGGTPYRLKIRAPSFVNLSILPILLPGHSISDAVVILGSLDFVMGECDR